MSNTKIWSGVVPLSILISIIVGILLLGRIGAKQNESIEENGTENIGTIVDVGGQRLIRVSYEVNGRIFIEGTAKPHSYLQPNEQFKMKYLAEDSESMVVFFDQPYLSEEQVYLETECTAISKTLSVVNFEYVVNGRKIKRETLYRDHHLSTSKYKVIYRVNNPLIGYLITK